MLDAIEREDCLQQLEADLGLRPPQPPYRERVAKARAELARLKQEIADQRRQLEGLSRLDEMSDQELRVEVQHQILEDEAQRQRQKLAESRQHSAMGRRLQRPNW